MKQIIGIVKLDVVFFFAKSWTGSNNDVKIYLVWRVPNLGVPFTTDAEVTDTYAGEIVKNAVLLSWMYLFACIAITRCR